MGMIPAHLSCAVIRAASLPCISHAIATELRTFGSVRRGPSPTRFVGVRATTAGEPLVRARTFSGIDRSTPLSNLLFFPIPNPLKGIDHTREDVQQMSGHSLEVSHIESHGYGVTRAQ